MKKYTCVAKTMLGLEDILADELEALNCSDVQVLNRAVSFTCDKATLYRVNLRSRFAISILVEWANFWARDEENYYKQIKRLNWDSLLSPDRTFMIQANIVRTKIFSHSQFMALKAKDAIVDFFQEKYGKRPSVDTVEPSLKINIHINGNKVSISLNSSGEPLFKRGYRVSMTRAPINEVLAAGIIELSGWNGQQPFYDPMCGSGTFLVEAGIKAHNIPPGMKRRFGFQKWLNYTPALWDSIYKEEVDKITDSNVRIYGSDKDAKAIEFCRNNIESSFLEDSLITSRKDFFKYDWDKDEMPFLIMNPPYDKRLRENDVIDFYKKIGDKLKFSYAGTQAWIISSNIQAMKFIGLRPSKRIKLFNGPLECRLCQYEMYSGSKKNRVEE